MVRLWKASFFHILMGGNIAMHNCYVKRNYHQRNKLNWQCLAQLAAFPFALYLNRLDFGYCWHPGRSTERIFGRWYCNVYENVGHGKWLNHENCWRFDLTTFWVTCLLISSISGPVLSVLCLCHSYHRPQHASSVRGTKKRLSFFDE